MNGATIQAIVCKEFGPPEHLVLETLPAPMPGPGEVAVAIRAAGVNFTDLLAVEGRSQLQRKLPIVPGVEAAGEIVAVGEGVGDFHIGRRVLGTRVQGAYAERAIFGVEEIYPIPDEMDFATAAAFYIGSKTAHYALIERARLEAGERLLVLGAGGGAGVAAVEIGSALGAHVTAAASSQDKLDLARRRGADAWVLYPGEALDLAAQKAFYASLQEASGPPRADAAGSIGAVSTLSRGRGFDVVFDAVGGSYTEPALRALAWQGRYLCIGFSAGVPAPSLGPLLFKNAQLLGIQPTGDEERLVGRNAAAMDQLLQWFQEGKLRPEITETYPLEHAGEALRRLKDRQAKGRIVLKMEGAE